MMRKIFPIVVLFVLLSSVGTEAEIIAGQAVSWTDFSHITCITSGYDYTYIGTTEGILRYNRRESRWAEPITISDGLPSRNIHRLSITFDEHCIYADTDDGVYSYDIFLESWSFEAYFPLDNYQDSRPPNPMPDIFMPFGYDISESGYITDSYFREFQITSYHDDQNEYVYVGTWGTGLIQADNQSLVGQLLPYGLLQKQTDAIYIDGDSLWLGGNGGIRPQEYSQNRLGVTLYDRHSGNFEHFEPRYISDFDSEIIYDISGDKDYIYFAGQNGLTLLSRKNEEFLSLSRRNGLPADEATAVVARNDSVWIGTARGLALYSPAKDSVVTISRDILQERFVTALKLAGNVLIIGTAKGTFYIDLKTKIIGRLKDPEGNLDGEIRQITLFKDELIISSAWGLTSVNMKSERSEAIPYLSSGTGAFAAAANDLYIAAAVEDGLVLIERKSGRIRHFTEADGLLSTRIRSIIPEGDFLWIGSDEGLTRFQWVNPDRVD